VSHISFFGTFSRRPVYILMDKSFLISCLLFSCLRWFVFVNGYQKFFAIVTKLHDQIMFNAGITTLIKGRLSFGMLATIPLRIFCFHTQISEYTKMWFCLLCCVSLVLVFSHWGQNIQGVREQGAQENSWAQATGGSRRLEKVLWLVASSYVPFIRYY